MAYTAHQYQLQHQIMLQIRWSGISGLCPVCRLRPSATWPDGTRRITCGDPVCYARWLPVRGEPATTPAPTGEETDHVTDHL